MLLIRCAVFTALILTAAMSQGRIAPVKHDHAKSLNQAVMQAAYDGNLNRMRVLLARGAEINGTDEDGENALVWAADGGQLRSINFLLKHGVSAADKNGDAALFTAVDEGQIGIIKSLLKYRANVNARDADGATPLMVACFYDAGEDGPFGQYPDVVKLLLLHRADVKAKDKRGKTALMYLRNKPDATIHRMLLAAGEKK